MDNQTDKQPKKAPNTAFWQLTASLVILGAALISRAFFPEATRGFLRDYIFGDYTAVFSEVGYNLRSLLLGGETTPPPSAEDNENEGVQPPLRAENGEAPSQPSGENDDNDGVPDPLHKNNEEAPFPPSGESDDNDGVPDPLHKNNEEAPFPPSGESDGIEEAPNIGGYDEPVLRVNALYFPSLSSGEDETLLPFETVLPVAGSVSSGFGRRVHPIYKDLRFHYGVDLAAAEGTPIAAFADGVAAAAGYGEGYGNYLIIEHDEGYISFYGHCRKVTVAVGQAVSAGETVALVGSTGLSTGPHLHFELRLGETFLDPSDYITV